MELQLDELIQSIKKEGIDAAQTAKETLLAEAQKEAQSIIERAQKEAAQRISDAEQQAKRFEQSSQAALQQAGRDLVLSLKKKIEEIFSRLLVSSVNESLNKDVLQNIISSVVSALGKESSSAKVIVSDKEGDDLVNFLKKKLEKELSSGLEIKPSADVTSGFRVEMKDGSAYYDFSDEKIAQMLSVYLNPKISQLLNS